MAGIISTRVVKDGNGTAFPGAVDFFDVSGAGTGPWVPVSLLYDPTSGAVATIKPASTAPVATDTALTVAIHPLSVNSNGQKNMASSAPVVIASDQSNLLAILQGATSGGLTETSIVTTAAAIVGSLKGSAGQIYKLEVANNSASWVYVKLYNSATAPTAGAGTPQRRIGVPPNSVLLTTSDIGGVYSTGIGYAIVGGAPDTDTTAVAANILVNFHFK